MSESQGRDLKPPEDGMFYENFGFGTFFWYHNFQNEIDAWESTVQGGFEKTRPNKHGAILIRQDRVLTLSTQIRNPLQSLRPLA